MTTSSLLKDNLLSSLIGKLSKISILFDLYKIYAVLLSLIKLTKILFIQKGNEVVICNSAMLALEKIQNSFDGEAERLGLEDEEDVAEMIKEFRKNRKKD